MKKKLLIFIAMINSTLLGVLAFLSVFMYKYNVSAFDEVSGWVIKFCVISSVLLKLKLSNKVCFCFSVLFDSVLVLYVYGLSDFMSITDFFVSLYQGVWLVLCYIYLIWFYYVFYNQKTVLN